MGASVVVALRNPRLLPNPKSIGIPFHRHQRIVTKAVNRVDGWLAEVQPNRVHAVAVKLWGGHKYLRDAMKDVNPRYGSIESI